MEISDDAFERCIRDLVTRLISRRGDSVTSRGGEEVSMCMLEHVLTQRLIL
jgi:hypothetical protein